MLRRPVLQPVQGASAPGAGVSGAGVTAVPATSMATRTGPRRCGVRVAARRREHDKTGHYGYRRHGGDELMRAHGYLLRDDRGRRYGGWAPPGSHFGPGLTIRAVANGHTPSYNAV